MRNKLNKLNELGFSEVIEVAGPRALRNVECTLTDEWRAKNVYEKQKQDLDLRYRSHIEENAWKVKTTLLPNELYPDIWIAKKAEDMIRNKKDTEPWFLWVSFVGPHEPFDTPKPWKGIHKFGDIKESKNNYDWIDRLDDQCLLKQKYNNWKGKIQDNDILKLKCDYGDHIKLLDDQVGNLMREINQRSDKNSWNIAITSDHGEILGDGGMLYKGSFQEGAIRVPWVYRGIRPCKSEPMQKTLGLTKIMKLMVRNLIKNGSSKRLRKKAERSDRAVVEFRDEILFIRGNKKLARKRSGKILWAVELERDGSEKENCYEKKQEELFRKEEWLEIKEWSDKEVTKRRRRNWFIDGIAESLN
ncbi:sulfatase subfamily S1_46 [Synechococcus sp. A15-28]|nr:sulfatase subfamily S1_46 [Synechococcus sp. A15-28]